MPRSMSRRSLAERFNYNCHPEPMSGCVLWSGKTRHDGYGTLMNKGKWLAAHRVAWELAGRGRLKATDVACHRCDNRICVNVDHIFIGTARDNVRDCWRKGRGVLGVRPGRAAPPVRLTESIVAEIKRRLSSGEPHAVIARAVGTSQSSVSNVKHGKHRRVV
jgi:hypothetical protein